MNKLFALLRKAPTLRMRVTSNTQLHYDLSKSSCKAGLPRIRKLWFDPANLPSSLVSFSFPAFPQFILSGSLPSVKLRYIGALCSGVAYLRRQVEMLRAHIPMIL